MYHRSRPCEKSCGGAGRINEPFVSQVQIKDVEFGKEVKIVQPVNLYGCKIGDETRIDPFVEIQQNATIGNGCKIQSHAFICEWVIIGDDCFISHGAMFINDPFAIGGPARGNKELWQRTKIGNRVSIGTNSTILPVTIVDNVVVGAWLSGDERYSETGYICWQSCKINQRVVVADLP